MIQLLIKNESDLYNPYDPSQKRLNEGIYHYLKSYCSPMEAPKHIDDTLQIITEDSIDIDRFQNALKDAVKHDVEELDTQISRNERRAVWELVVGILLIALGITLSAYLDKLLLTVISLFGTMGVRDSVSIKTTINHDLKRLKRRIEPMGDIKLKVVQHI